MLGLMMDQSLLISSLIRHADRNHGDTEIVSRSVEGPIHRYTYRAAHVRARRLARALARLPVQDSSRRTAGFRPETSERSTTMAICRSPTAPRT